MAWTTPRSWVAAEVVTAALLNTHLRDNLTALGQWTTYSPTWASASNPQPAIGSGTITGRYSRIGKTVWYEVILSAAANTTYGTGAWSFTLPSTSADANHTGTARIYQVTGGNWFVGVAYHATTATVTAAIHGGTGNATLAPAVPFTWAAAGDSVLISGHYTEA